MYPVGTKVVALVNCALGIGHFNKGDTAKIVGPLPPSIPGTYKIELCDAPGDAWYMSSTSEGSEFKVEDPSLVPINEEEEPDGNSIQGIRAGDIFMVPSSKRIYLFIGRKYYDLSNDRMVGTTKPKRWWGEKIVVIGNTRAISGSLFKHYTESIKDK
jgi:hypothetical protein